MLESTEKKSLVTEKFMLSPQDREEILIAVTEIINSNNSIEVIKQKVVSTVGKMFKADRCFIRIFNSDDDKFEIIDAHSEYLNSPNIKSLVGYRFDEIFDDFVISNYKQGKCFFLPDAVEFFNNNSQITCLSKLTVDLGVKSNYCCPILHEQNLTGALIVHYIERNVVIGQKETELLKIISKQIISAILTDISKKQLIKQKEQEQLLRKIIQSISSLWDKNIIKKNIVVEIGKTLMADRVFIVEYDSVAKKYLPVDKDAEYLSSPKLPSLTELDLNKIPGFDIVTKIHQKNKEIIYSDLEKFIESQGIKDFNSEFFYRFNRKASAAMLIKHGDEFIGNLVVHYSSKKIFSNEDIGFLRALTNQAGIALNQARLYENISKKAKREELIRKIVNKIRSTIDLDELKKSVVNEIGKVLDADRCYFRTYDTKKGIFLSPGAVYSTSLSVVDPNKSKVNFETTKFLFDNPCHREDVDQYIKEKNLVGTAIEQYFKDNSIKSDYPQVIWNKDGEITFLVLQYTKKIVRLSTEDLEMLDTLSKQVEIAIGQSKIYESLKQTAERETLLRKVTSTIRGTFDIKEIKQLVVDEVGKAFNADRCFFRSIDLNTKKYSVPDVEYLSSNKIMSLKNIEPDHEGINYFINRAAKNKESFIIKNIPQYIEDNKLQGSPVERYEKEIQNLSDYPFPVWDMESNPTYLVLHYTQKPIALKPEQIETLESIAKQVGIALDQSKLYESLKKQVNKELVIKNIITKINSTLDFEQIKNYIVKEIGEILNATRCFLVEFDEAKNCFLPIRNEYLNSERLNTSIGYDFEIMDPAVAQKHKELFEIIVPDTEAFVANEPAVSSLYNKHIEYFGFKSGFSIPISFLDAQLGDLLVHFENKYSFNEEDLDFVRTLAKQTSFAFYQVKLLEKTKKLAEYEALQSTIINTIRSTIDLNKMKKSIVNEIGKTLDADICVIHQYDLLNENFLPIDESSEYRSSEDIISFVGINIEDDIFTYFKNIYLSQKSIIEANWPEYLQKTTKISKEAIESLKKLNIKSNYALPIIQNGELQGMLYLVYTKKQKNLSLQEQELLYTLINQISIALNQADLFQKEKIAHKSEKIISRIIAKTRNTLDLDENFLVICNELEQLYNMSKIVIANFSEKKKTIKTYKEYSSNHDNIGLLINSSRLINDFLYKIVANNKEDIFINNISQADIPELIKAEFDLLAIKSIIIKTLKMDNNNKTGIIIFDNKIREWNNNDLYFIGKIVEQVDYLIKNSKLYNQMHFSANVSHELKTPIAIIKGYSEALLKKSLNNQVLTEEFLRIIVKNTDRIDEIINNLLYISNLGKYSENNDIEMKQESVFSLIENVIGDCLESSGQKNISIINKCQKDIKFKFNLPTLNQALVNLVSNAIKYSDSDSLVIIDAKIINNELNILVKDNGCGISDYEFKNIFERFYRVEKSRSRETGGSGLGLPIVKLVCEIHGGSISVNSKPSKGSTFIIHIPKTL